jgi:hypothetical protein
MSKTATPIPLGDRRLNRLLLARTHPDAGGSHELSLYTQALLERAEGCRCPSVGSASEASSERFAREDAPARVAFDFHGDHVVLIRRAAEIGSEMLDSDIEDMHGGLLFALLGYQQATSKRGKLAERRGATYKQLKYVAVLSELEPQDVYAVAERIPMSQAMAHYLISELKDDV